LKATFDIPDDPYRRVKARSALEGRPLRSVAVELFQNWLSVTASPPAARGEEIPGDRKPTRFDTAPWAHLARPYLRPGMSHDLDEMKEAIARGWGEDAAEKLNDSQDSDILTLS
jgi:hypothetical protein